MFRKFELRGYQIYLMGSAIGVAAGYTGYYIGVVEGISRVSKALVRTAAKDLARFAWEAEKAAKA